MLSRLSVLAIVVAFAVLGLPASVHAQIPSVLPLQGFLADATGSPIDEPVDMVFALYESPSATVPFYEESTRVRVERGHFSANVGEAGTLDLAIFRTHRAAYLGITVGDDAELAPRTRLGSVPYAAVASYADEAGTAQTARSADTLGGLSPSDLGVPRGAMMFFEGSSCPVGWSTYGPAAGRTIVALGTGSTPGATVGSPLGDREDRAHDHTVGPRRLTASSSGAHTHVVDPAMFGVSTRAYTGGFTPRLGAGSLGHASPHDHFHHVEIDVPATTSSSSGAHSHDVSLPVLVSSPESTSDVIPYIQLLLCRRM